MSDLLNPIGPRKVSDKETMLAAEIIALKTIIKSLQAQIAKLEAKNAELEDHDTLMLIEHVAKLKAQNERYREAVGEALNALELIQKSNEDDLLIPYRVQGTGRVAECHPGYVAYYEYHRIKKMIANESLEGE